MSLGFGTLIGPVSLTFDYWRFSPSRYDILPEINNLQSLVCICVSFYLLCLIAMEQSRLRATLGKMATGIKVTNLNGQQITFFQSVVRTLLKFVFLAPFGVLGLFAVFTPRKQGLHDLIARTLVVKSR